MYTNCYPSPNKTLYIYSICVTAVHTFLLSYPYNTKIMALALLLGLILF